MGLLDFFKRMNLATGGQDPNKAMFAGLEALGLKVASMQGAVTDLAGTFRGREAAMHVDGSRIMGAGNAALAMAAGTALAGSLGLISPRFQDWRERRQSFRARQMMQDAQMVIRWAVFSQTPSPGAVNIGRHASIGEPIGNGLHFAGDATAKRLVLEVMGPIAVARFDEISVDGQQFQAFWAPPMREYQKVASSPQVFTDTAAAALTALSALCDRFVGPIG